MFSFCQTNKWSVIVLAENQESAAQDENQESAAQEEAENMLSQGMFSLRNFIIPVPFKNECLICRCSMFKVNRTRHQKKPTCLKLIQTETELRIFSAHKQVLFLPSILFLCPLLCNIRMLFEHQLDLIFFVQNGKGCHQCRQKEKSMSWHKLARSNLVSVIHLRHI